MAPTIRVSDNTFSRLEQHANGFDTPDGVITRLLDKIDGEQHNSLPRVNSALLKSSDKDLTKYEFRGQCYVKRRLVHAVVSYHAENLIANSDMQILYDDFLKVFPDSLQGSKLGVICKVADTANRCSDPDDRYFLRPEQQIQLADCKFAVCSQWGANFNGGNIQRFLEHADKVLHYDIKKAPR